MFLKECYLIIRLLYKRFSSALPPLSTHEEKYLYQRSLTPLPAHEEKYLYQRFLPLAAGPSKEVGKGFARDKRG
jgi:hypothetical protein